MWISSAEHSVFNYCCSCWRIEVTF